MITPAVVYKTQPIETTANESLAIMTGIVEMSSIDAAEDEVIANAGAYDKDLSLFKPWTSRTMAP